MRYLVAIVVAFVVVLGLALLVLLSGVYNVSAANEEVRPISWAMSEIAEASIEAHAKGVRVPDVSQVSLETGFQHYNEMCVVCHGAPGIEPDEIGKGLNPRAPNLQREAGEFNSAELYWVLKNGIKMTGMPAFGPTHSEQELWAMVRFVEQLPKMSPAQYSDLKKKFGGREESGEHEAGPAH